MLTVYTHIHYPVVEVLSCKAPFTVIIICINGY